MHVRGRTDKDSCWRDSGLAGIAVSWAALPLICAMYAQAQSKPTGMGIGLSICRSIIEAHEERIWATANMPRGVTLHITLLLRENHRCVGRQGDIHGRLSCANFI
jgi:K+-sensing histidine kinase KdpD